MRDDDDDDDFDDDDDDDRPFFSCRNNELLILAKAAISKSDFATVDAILDELEYRGSDLAIDVEEEIRRLLAQVRLGRPDQPPAIDFSRTPENSRAHMRLGPGGVLARRYRLGEKLGVGGFAEVFEGIDLDNVHGPKIVIKYPLEATSAESLRHEFSIGSKLSHPNICAYYACLDDHATGQAFLVIQHGGKSIAEMLRAGKKFNFADLLRVANHIGEALKYAHGQTPSVLHLDVSPANILVDSNGVSRLTDFGISTRAMTRAGHTRNTKAPGTVAAFPLGKHDVYSAPEVFMPPPAQVGRRADQWSLAMVLFSMAAGRVFSNREEFSGVGLPPAPTAALERALSNDPKQRFPNMADFIAALGA